jgi:uncharacterized membrane protein YbaN (DUF454 family)
MTTPECPITDCCRRRRLDPVRLWLAGVGVVCVGMGALGVFIPGLPTTIFLIIASWCFARSCPWLERRLIRNRFFAPFLRFLEPGTVMPTRARIIASVMMWTAIAVSIAFLFLREASVWMPLLVALAGLVGTVAIWTIARPRRGEPVPA